MTRAQDWNNWTPTPENVNALPLPLRRYIHALQTDPHSAGTIRDNVLLRDENARLRALIAEQDWRPIATAPKDAVIDLWHPEYGRITDQWWDSEDGFDWPVAGSTHWMPTPTPPPPSGAAPVEGE